jgi:hypothetical protein
VGLFRVLHHVVHVLVSSDELLTLSLCVFVKLHANRMDVLHQVLSRVESLLALVDLLSVEVDLRLHTKRLLVHELLFLVGHAARVPRLLVNVALNALHLSIHPHFIINVLLRSTVLFLPSIEVRLDGLRLLVPLSLWQTRS